jgi:hypothetical protein
VFGWLKPRPQTRATDELIVTQPHGEVFPWPKGAVLTAVDERVLALPTALFDKARPMSEFVFAPDGAQMNIPPDGNTCFVRLMPGMSISLAKTVQSYVISDDQKPRRIKVQRPPADASSNVAMDRPCVGHETGDTKQGRTGNS